MKSHCQSCGQFAGDCGRCKCADGRHKVFEWSDGSFRADPEPLSWSAILIVLALAVAMVGGLWVCK